MDLLGKKALIGKKYKLINKMRYRDVYLGIRADNNQFVEIKLEDNGSDTKQLDYERKIYIFLQGGIGIPNIYWYGEENGYRIMVTDRLGPSLRELFRASPRPFSLKTVLMLASQMLVILQFFHEKNLIHRDIHPRNFLIGLGENASKIYISNYGIAKKYRHPETLEHIAYRDGKCFIGTYKYASLNVHFGIEQGRRDDLESLGYILIYFLKGSLPWQNERAHTYQEKREKILDKKIHISVKELCEGLPEEFAIYLDYIRQLHFEDRPDYLYLRQLFKARFLSEGYEYDSIFDWNIPAQNNFYAVQKDEEIKVKENEGKKTLKIQEIAIKENKNTE